MRGSFNSSQMKEYSDVEHVNTLRPRDTVRWSTVEKSSKNKLSQTRNNCQLHLVQSLPLLSLCQRLPKCGAGAV